LVTGAAAAGLLVAARRRSDQPAGTPGRLGHPDPAGADRRGHGPSGRLVQQADAGHGAGHPVRRRAGPRRRRRPGGAPDRHRHPLGAASTRGRRLPHPGPQHRGGPGLRLWVLAIGAAATRSCWPAGWPRGLRAPLPPRFWRKVVAAVQGVVLTVAASGDDQAATGRDDRGRRRAAAAGRVVRPRRALAIPHQRQPARPPAVAVTIAALALALLWFTLLLPDRIYQIIPRCFCPRPIELLVLLALALVLPPWPDASWPLSPGSSSACSSVAKFLNMG